VLVVLVLGLGMVGGALGFWLLWVEQAFEVLLLPGLGVGNFRAQVLWHATFICDSGVNVLYNLTCM